MHKRLLFSRAGATMACASLAFLLSHVVLGADDKPRTFSVGTVAWAGFAPLNVADQKQFWKSQGLDVHVTIFPSNQEVNTALQDGKIDLALDMIGSWIGMHQNGVPLVIVGETDWSHGGDKIIARRDCDFSKLRGTRVGVYLDQPSVTFFLDRFLRENGLGFEDVDVVELDPRAMADHFIAGRVSLIVNYDPQAMRAEREGGGIVVATSATFPGVIPEGFAALEKNWAGISATDKARFWRGWLGALAWSRDPANWREFKTILNEHTFPNDPDFSDAELRSMVNSVSMHSREVLAARNKPAGPLGIYVDEVKTFLENSGRFRRKFITADILSTDALVSEAQGTVAAR